MNAHAIPDHEKGLLKSLNPLEIGTNGQPEDGKGRKTGPIRTSKGRHRLTGEDRKERVGPQARLM